MSRSLHTHTHTGRKFRLANHPVIPQVFSMGAIHVLTASEQVAGYLREELRRGTWHETMPGEDRLVAQLGVGRDTIKMALRSLEEEGLLVGQGVGRRRKIVLPEDQQRNAWGLPIKELPRFVMKS